MFSIFWYIGDNLVELETTGFPTVEHAKSAITSDRIWFRSSADENVHIPMAVKLKSVAVIKDTLH